MLKRRDGPEIMDDFSIQDHRVDRALEELRQINRYLGGKAATARALQILKKKCNLQGPLSVLDVGAGGGDVFEDMAGQVNITALDRNPRVCRILRERGLASVICADALHPPVKEQSFDVVHASLFLHHFDKEAIRSILLYYLQISRHGFIINDLRRSVVAYAAIKLLTFLLSHSAMVQHDGPLSVLRGFSRKELVDILESCGIASYSLQRTWAFRWVVVIEKNTSRVGRG